MIGKKDKVYFFSVRYTDIYGNKKQKYQSNPGWKLKKEAQAAADQFLISVAAEVKNITVGQLFGMYYDDMCTRAKQVTSMNELSNYKNHIAPYFDKVQLSTITPRQITIWQDTLMKQGYTNKTLKTIQMKFRSLLNYAIDHDFIERSPFRTRTSQNTKELSHEVSFWTPEEFNRFIEGVDDYKLKTLYMVLYWSGLRKGEAMALTIKDIDFVNGVIIVNKTFDYAHAVTTSPKTSGSNRRVRMTGELSALLKEYTDGILAIKGADKTANLFYLDYHISTATIEHTKNEVCRKVGVKQIRIHDFRHSHVSLLINMGITPFEISKRLGHSIKMVEDVYGHLFESSQTVMVERLDEVSRQLKQAPKVLN